MKAEKLFWQLLDKGVTFQVINGDIKIKAPKKTLTKEMIDIIRANKQVFTTLVLEYPNNNIAPIRPTKQKDKYPATSVQKRMVILQKLNPTSVYYNVPFFTLWEGPIEEKKFIVIFQALIQKYEILRTCFIEEEGEIYQKIFPVTNVNLHIQNFTKESEVAIFHNFIKPFDLATGPLLRIGLIKKSSYRYILLIDMHHIVTDLMSQRILLAEIIDLYHGKPLRKAKLQYKDYSEWVNNRVKQKELKQQEQYWLNEFSDYNPQIQFPTDFIRSENKSYRGSTIFFSLSDTFNRELRNVARQRNATLAMVLHTLFHFLLAKLSGNDDIIVGIPVSGRTHQDLTTMIGMFVNTLAIRTKIEKRINFLDFLEVLKNKYLHGINNQEYPFEELVRNVCHERDMSRNPIFDIMYVFENNYENIPDGELVKVSEYQENLTQKTAKFDLTLFCYDRGSHIDCAFEYNSDLFKQETIEKYITYFKIIINQVIVNSKIPFQNISIITKTEQIEVLYQFNQTEKDYSRTRTIHKLFEEQVTRNPDSIAIAQPTFQITYQELNRKANQTARQLRHIGVQNEDYVGILLDRQPELIIALLAILKAGGVYIPLEPDFPQHRITGIHRSLKTRWLISQQKYLSKLADFLPEIVDMESILLLDIFNPIKVDVKNILKDISQQLFYFSDCVQWEDKNLNLSIDNEQLAYIIFTSGSTGIPKGVMVKHRPVINLIEWVNKTFSVNSFDKLLFLTSVCFDLSVYDIFGSLASGAAIRIVNEVEKKDPQKLLSIILQEKITFWDSAPAAFQQLLPFIFEIAPVASIKAWESLRLVFLSGDWVSLGTPDIIKRAFKNVKVIVLGGATEATVWSNYFEVKTIDPQWKSIPYGKPIANVFYYILDKNLKPCPIGIEGDLYISGECLASGYVNDEEMSAASFIPNPFVRDGIMYKTGDLSRWFPDGNIEFLGRKDGQIKLRGYRIELGEIENTLTKHEEITDAVAAVKERNGSRYLVCYYISQKSQNQEKLKFYLSRFLPDYMIPVIFVKIDSIPLTINGKIDRKALPMPEFIKSYKNSTEEIYSLKPITVNQIKLAKIWSCVLGIPEESIHLIDDFFKIGGHSLKIISLLARIITTFNVHYNVIELMKNSTLIEMARLIDDHKKSNSHVVTFNESSKVQIFCFPDIIGFGFNYAYLAELLKKYAFTTFDFFLSTNIIKYYSDEIVRLASEDTLILLGYSAGGNLAFEVTKELEHRKKRVAHLILLDSYFKTTKISFHKNEVIDYVQQFFETYNLYLEDSLKQTILEKTVVYFNFFNPLINRGKIKANIHLIKSENRQPTDGFSDWQDVSTTSCRNYNGQGKHMEMFSPPYIKKNACLIERILESRIILNDKTKKD